MAIVAADLKAYSAVNDAANPPGPDDDGAQTVGGAIDEEYQVVFHDGAAGGGQIDAGTTPDALEFVTSGGPVGTIVVRARHLTGVLESSPAIALAAGPVAVTFPVGLDNDIVNIHSITLDAALAGGDTVTLRHTGAGTVIHLIAALERGAIRLFRESSSDVSAEKIRYEKFFLLNDHASLSLLNAVVTMTTDLSLKHEFALETTINGNNSIADRLDPGVPSGITAFGTAPITLLTAVSNADMTAQDRIGVWVKQTLAIGASPISDVQDRITFTLSGDTAP